jgi:hypothetical protein
MRLALNTDDAAAAGAPGRSWKNRFYTSAKSRARIEPEPSTSWKTL